MAYVSWDYYDIYDNKRRYQILIPEEISQFWTVYYPDADKMWEMDIDFIGNRKGLEAFRNACAILAEKENMAVYFPCKKNPVFPMHDYIFRKWEGPHHMYYADFVLMKPGTNLF